jgi:hypothetical protein
VNLKRLTTQGPTGVGGEIDIDGIIRDLIDLLAVGDPGRPYATAEKLAELGNTAIAKCLEGSESLADIMLNVSG